MLRVVFQDRRCNGARFERYGRIALAVRDRSEQRQCIEGSGFIIGRELFGEVEHAIGVRADACGPVTGFKQPFDGLEIRFLARGRRLLQARGRRRPEAAKRCASLLDVLVVPERLVVAHGLAPVAERERRIHPLHLPELRNRVVVFEAVKQKDAADEVRLSGGGA